MTIKIHGKEYSTVAERISAMKSAQPEWRLSSEILSSDEVVVFKARVLDGDGKEMGVGHAEEVRGSTNINQTSALENCETSAWGRALASCNYGGSQVASANEVTDAILNQGIIKATERLIRHNNALRDNLSSISFIKDALSEGKWDSAAEAMAELDEDVRQSINLAATKGGVFDLEDTRLFKTDEYAAARSRYFDEKRNGGS